MYKEPQILVHRYAQDDKQSSGSCKVLDLNGFPLFSSLSMERGWRNNESNVSCYPIGIYWVELEYSDAFGKDLWEVKGVPNRSECKFHSANYWKQLKGCTALGLEYIDMDADGYRDVTSSGPTMTRFHKALKGFTRAKLIVTGERNIF
jgi:hypothetical protein